MTVPAWRNCPDLIRAAGLAIADGCCSGALPRDSEGVEPPSTHTAAPVMNRTSLLIKSEIALEQRLLASLPGSGGCLAGPNETSRFHVGSSLAGMPVPVGVAVESLQATLRAEEERRVVVRSAARSSLWIDFHPANGVFCHVSPPQNFGVKRFRVIEFITTDTELKPIAAPAMIGFRTIFRPSSAPVARTPAATGIRAVL